MLLKINNMNNLTYKISVSIKKLQNILFAYSTFKFSFIIKTAKCKTYPIYICN